MKPLSYIFFSLYKPVLKFYLRTDSNIRFDGFKLNVRKGVFHPKLFFSTPYFYSFLKQQTLKELAFLEIGSGSGVLSLLAQRKGAKVTALDISTAAVETTQFNFDKNFKDHSARILQSDLFSQLPPQAFDVIVVNPPYFFKDVSVESQHAWYCGANGEYFEALFSGIKTYCHAGTVIYMILADNCEIERIQEIAARYHIRFLLKDEKLIHWERNFIYQLVMHS